MATGPGVVLAHTGTAPHRVRAPLVQPTAVRDAARVNEQELVLRVGELAGRVGYPVPAVSWVRGVAGEHCVLLQEDGRTLLLHETVDEQHSAPERDLLIAQELIQARQGGPRHRRWIKMGEALVGGGLGIAAVQIMRQQVDSVWLAYSLAMGSAYVGWMVFHVVVGVVWTRWFTRRADRALAEVVGRDQVVQWLRGIAAMPLKASARLRLRWILRGAPPLAAERLRMLGERTFSR